MRSGLYRHYANVEQYVKTATGDRGQTVGSWRAIYTNVPMSIESLSGRQLELARQLVATATHKIQLRYLAGVTPMMRVNYNGYLFNIDSINEGDFRLRYLSLICTEEIVGN